MSAGQAYEDAASELLLGAGLKVLERNFRCKSGEIDIICQDGLQLVFVEVRARNNCRYGSAAASVTPAKQGRLIRAAHYFLLQYRSPDKPACRFDVIAYGADSPLRQNCAQTRPGNTVQWIKNAFTI